MPRGTKGLEFAADLTKQLITLATGMVALTMTFAEKLGTTTGGVVEIPDTLKWSWVSFAVALVFAIITLMGITGTISELDREKDSNPDRTNIKWPARVMIGAFGVAMILVFLTGIRAWW